MTRKIIFATFLVILIGCATMDKMKTLKRFQDAERGYRTLLARSQFEPAMRYIEPTWLKDHPDTLKLLKDYRITSCEVEKATISEDGARVTQKVVIHYFKTDRMVLKKMRNEQDWRYNRDQRRWFLTNGMPRFN